MTLTGQAERAHEATPTTGLGTHVQDVVDALSSRDLRDVVLVGHSYGSAVTGAAAGRVPERIAQLVFVSDGPSPPETSIFELMGEEAAGMMEGMASAAGDPDRLPFPARDVFDRFYGDHGFDDALYESVAARATPLPLGGFRERTRQPSLPRTGSRGRTSTLVATVRTRWIRHHRVGTSSRSTRATGRCSPRRASSQPILDQIGRRVDA